MDSTHWAFPARLPQGRVSANRQLTLRTTTTPSAVHDETGSRATALFQFVKTYLCHNERWCQFRSSDTAKWYFRSTTSIIAVRCP